MFLINVLAVVLFIYLAYYFFYLTYITYCLKPGRIKEIEKRNYAAKFKQSISVIVYSHNNVSTVVNLVEMLKKQDYEYDSYEINVILDNCADDSAKKLEIVGGARLWRINNPDNVPVGKNKAIAWLLERILKQENTNAFVFLNGDCIIKNDLLMKINNELIEHPVITGRVITPRGHGGGYVSEYGRFISGIKNYRRKVQDLLLNSGRGFAGLGSVLNTDICAIRQDILEKVAFNPISNNNAEVDYSLELNKNNIPILYCAPVAVFRQTPESLSLYLKKINIKLFAQINGFKNHLKELSNKETPLAQKEFILSLIYPSEIILAVSLLLLTNFSHNPGCIINAKLSAFIVICYVLAVGFADIMAKISLKDMFYGALWALFSPFMLGYNLIKNTNKRLLVRMSFNKLKPEQTNTGINAIVTDGVNEFPCRIEVISEDGLHQIIFWFKTKNIISSKHLRSSDALQEIIDKLFEHKLALKVCQNCGYFKLSNSGRTVCDKGKCLIGLVNDVEEAPRATYIWNYCSKMIPIHAREYVMKQLENKGV